MNANLAALRALAQQPFRVIWSALMKASQQLQMRHSLTAELPFGKGHAGPTPFLACGQASPLAPNPLFSLFPWDSPLAGAAQRLVAVKNYVQWRPLTMGRGFWVGRELPPARWDAQKPLFRRAPCTEWVKCRFSG